MQSAFLKCKSWLCLWVWNTSVVSVCHILAIVSKNIGSWYLIPNRITHSSGWRKKKTYACVKIHLNKNIKTRGSKSFEQHVDSHVGSKYWSRILAGALLLWQIMVACHYRRVVVLCHCARVVPLWNYGRIAVAVWYNRKVGALCHCGSIVALIVAVCKYKSAVHGAYWGSDSADCNKKLQCSFGKIILDLDHPWSLSSEHSFWL